jgi:hypothetical protein
MDIVQRLTLCAARQPRTDAAQLMLEAIAHIEALRKEIRTQRNEIAGLREERNASDQRLATADETTPRGGIASPLHPYPLVLT